MEAWKCTCAASQVGGGGWVCGCRDELDWELVVAKCWFSSAAMSASPCTVYLPNSCAFAIHASSHAHLSSLSSLPHPPAAWLTPKLEFLPRQLGRLEEHPLLDLLSMSHNRYPFYFHCPRWQRRRRLGPWGAAPQDAREEELERQAEADIAVRLGYAPPQPSSSAPAASSMYSIETLSDSGTELTAAEEAGPTAASGQRAAKPAGGRGRGRAGGGASGRGRGRAAAAAAPGHPPSSGLALLNGEGRPKFYHSRTCVAMTREELFAEAGQAGGDASDSEGDLSEWQASLWCFLCGRLVLCSLVGRC